MDDAAKELRRHAGRCHCGAVRFSVLAPTEVVVHQCNCSLCARTGFLHLIVPASRFTLEQGAEALTEYRWNTGVARHLFCRICGVKAFYVPRSNPDGYSVDVRSLDRAGFREVTIEPFDGQRWEASAAVLAGLSRDPA